MLWAPIATFIKTMFREKSHFCTTWTNCKGKYCVFLVDHTHSNRKSESHKYSLRHIHYLQIIGQIINYQRNYSTDQVHYDKVSCKGSAAPFKILIFECLSVLQNRGGSTVLLNFQAFKSDSITFQRHVKVTSTVCVY